MTKLNQVLIGSTLALLSLTAVAGSGAYAGAGAGQVSAKDSFDGASFDGTDAALKAFAGYHFNDHFALEAAYVDAGAPSDYVYGASIYLDSQALELSAIGILPVSDKVGLFLRGSMLSWDSNVTVIDGYDVYYGGSSGTNFGWGVGMAAQFTRHFGIRAEFEGANLDGTDFRLLSLSAVFHF